MSSSFIGSKIAIVTKSQSRYSGTIIGIDAQASSIVLGNVKCYGTENRQANLGNGQSSGTLVPIMQFANSDIEDLKIVDEESGTETSSKQTTNSVSAPGKQASIHDDPAILSAVVSSSSNKESSSVPSRLIRDLNQLNLSDDNKKILPKTDESRLRTDSGDLGGSWSLLSPSKWNGGNSLAQVQPSSNNKSKFFDNFALTAIESGPSHRPQRWTSSLNTHATQTSNRSNQHDDERDLPTRQPFFADDQSFSPQQNFSSNGSSYQHRNFSNQRRPPMRRRPMGGGNRETFYDNGVHYEDEFDFESSNRKFNKISNEDDFNQQTDSLHQFKAPIDNHRDPNVEFQPVYDKKKSFFDNISVQETADLPVPMYHRSRNQDTFGNNHHNDRYQRQKFRGNGNAPGGQRRSNYHNNGNNNSNNNQNGYHYRY